jgi:hypothetical protein
MTIANQVQASPGLYVNTPGQPITNNVALPQQVGMLPPAGNLQGGGCVLGALANAGASGAPALAANAYITNEGIGNNLTISVALSTGSDGGNSSQPSLGVPFGQASGGGVGAAQGAGGLNMNSAVGVVGDTALGAQAPPQSLTFEGGAATPHYAG